MRIFRATKDDQLRYAEAIPKLERSRQWAVRQLNAAMQGSHPQRRQKKVHHAVSSSDSSASFGIDDVQEFLAFQDERIREERERRLEAQLALKKKVEDEKAEEERLKRKEIEEEGIKIWLAQQQLAIWKAETEQQTRSVLVQESLRKELERLKFPPDQIQKAVEHAAVEASSRPLHEAFSQQESIKHGRRWDSNKLQRRHSAGLRSLLR